jgi:two-component system response regulator HydG
MEEFRMAGAKPNLKGLVEAYERRVIEDALRAVGGNQRQAAKSLGVLPTTLHEKMKRMGLLRREADVEVDEPVALAG